MLQSSKVSDKAAVKTKLQFSCDRFITVDHIPIDSNCMKDSSSHVQQWDENCGWTKLRIFELESYDVILYIDADCLVVKDISSLLHIDKGETCKRYGLLAAAPDIFPPDKFNAGVMVIRPSKLVFDDMMNHLPSTSSDEDSNQNCCNTYDGGDTGFLNSYYPTWFTEMPSYSRLSFGYNAQRFMHHCTFEKQPKYWDDGIDDLRIIHFSSSPKPWETVSYAKQTNGESNDASKILGENEKEKLQQSSGALESLWQTAYKQSRQYYAKELKKQQAQKLTKKSPQPKAVNAKPKVKLSPHQMVQRRYKELRRMGYSTTKAMQTARDEYGMNGEYDPCRAVGQMFGL